MPSGVPHATRCEDQSSLHISIGLAPWTSKRILDFTLARLAEEDSVFRKPVLARSTDSNIVQHAIDAVISHLKSIAIDDRIGDFRRAAIGARKNVSDLSLTRLCTDRTLSESTLISKNASRQLELVNQNGKVRLFSSASYKSPDNNLATPPYIEFPDFVTSELKFILDIENPIFIKDIPSKMDNQSKIVLIKELLRHDIVYAG